MGEAPGDLPELSEPQIEHILRFARRTLEAHTRGEEPPGWGFFPDQPQVLGASRGVFVTLRKHGKLRGCIGLVNAVRPLWQGIAEMTIASATRDERFAAVTAEELADIHIEISILSATTPVRRMEDVRIGRDGLVIRCGDSAGVFLPQIASDNGWDLDTYFSQTCRKASLPEDRWKGAFGGGGDVEIARFSTLKIVEERT